MRWPTYVLWIGFSVPAACMSLVVWLKRRAGWRENWLSIIVSSITCAFGVFMLALACHAHGDPPIDEHYVLVKDWLIALWPAMLWLVMVLRLYPGSKLQHVVGRIAQWIRKRHSG